MHGYMRPTGEYYESDNGPLGQSDLRVPLRPSEMSEWRGGRWVMSSRHVADLPSPDHSWPRKDDMYPQQDGSQIVKPERVRISLTLPQMAAVVSIIVSSAGLVWKVWQLETKANEQQASTAAVLYKIGRIEHRLVTLETMRGMAPQWQEGP